MKFLIIFLIAVIAPTCMGQGGMCNMCANTDAGCDLPDGGSATAAACTGVCLTMIAGGKTDRSCDPSQTVALCQTANPTGTCCEKSPCNPTTTGPTNTGGSSATQMPLGGSGTTPTDTSSNVRPEFTLSIGAALCAMGFTLSI